MVCGRLFVETQNFASLRWVGRWWGVVNQQAVLVGVRLSFLPINTRIYGVIIGNMNANDKFKGKYRVPSARWANWNYGNNAAYFITVCTHERIPFFGEITDYQNNLTIIGQAVSDCWYSIPEHFPFVLLDEFVIMPNHIHGILIINKSTPYEVSGNRFGSQSQNLASIVRGFKIGVTKFAHQHNLGFGWQPRYHDRIIRTTEEHDRIRQYIHDNPRMWRDDPLYKSTP